MHDLPSPTDILQSFVYPVCLLSGLIGGLVTRRWPLAAAFGFVLAPLLDYAGNQAFSDAHPHFVPVDSLLFAIVGAILAVAVWALKQFIQRRRRSA